MRMRGWAGWHSWTMAPDDSSDPSDDPGEQPQSRPPMSVAGASAGSAYLVSPDGGNAGPGVLVLHSWWGLNRGIKEVTERLAGAGFTALAPDLFGGTELADPRDPIQAAMRLAGVDVDATAGLILASIMALRAHSADPQAPVGVLGFSMGASWALWAAGRQPDSVGAVVAYYGHQDMDFEGLAAPVLCHFAELDPLVSEDQAAQMQAHIRLVGGSFQSTTHPGTRHFFAESGVPVMGADGAVGERGVVEEVAEATAWEQTVEFLRRHAHERSVG